jgi:hypothetical protein
MVSLCASFGGANVRNGAPGSLVGIVANDAGLGKEGAMDLIRLPDIDGSILGLVGGKAAGLGEMIKAGERVPDGFCLTVESYRSGRLPEKELVEAYERLGGGRVAVRSSATAEDLPEASFAGQQDTYLNVEGPGELIDAVRRCWDSLFTERAVAYRAAAGVDDAAMAVVVQRMIDPVAAGVMFTANPITGCRTEMVVDAAPGLGTAIVEGTVVPDLVRRWLALSRGQRVGPPPQARSGVRTHALLMAIIRHAELGHGRRDILNELAAAALRRSWYAGSEEELLPLRSDPGGAIPLALISAVLLVSPRLWKRLAGSGMPAHALTPEGWQQLAGH